MGVYNTSSVHRCYVATCTDFSSTSACTTRSDRLPIHLNMKNIGRRKYVRGWRKNVRVVSLRKRLNRSKRLKRRSVRMSMQTLQIGSKGEQTVVERIESLSMLPNNFWKTNVL